MSSPAGARATATVGAGGSVSVSVSAGEALDDIVLRSYVVGAVHQALGWVRSEGVAVDEDGTVLDLTIRSFGIIAGARHARRSRWWWRTILGPPLAVGDTVFAAVAAAAWLAAGLPPAWPVDRGGARMSTPVGPYAPAMRAGPWLVCSGQIGIEQGPDGPALVAGGFEAQARKALANVSSLLWGRQVGWSHVVKTTVFLTDMAHYAEFNAVYAEVLGRPPAGALGRRRPRTAPGGARRDRGLGLRRGRHASG